VGSPFVRYASRPATRCSNVGAGGETAGEAVGERRRRSVLCKERLGRKERKTENGSEGSKSNYLIVDEHLTGFLVA